MDSDKERNDGQNSESEGSEQFMFNLESSLGEVSITFILISVAIACPNPPSFIDSIILNLISYKFCMINTRTS